MKEFKKVLTLAMREQYEEVLLKDGEGTEFFAAGKNIPYQSEDIWMRHHLDQIFRFLYADPGKLAKAKSGNLSRGKFQISGKGAVYVLSGLEDGSLYIRLFLGDHGKENWQKSLEKVVEGSHQSHAVETGEEYPLPSNSSVHQLSPSEPAVPHPHEEEVTSQEDDVKQEVVEETSDINRGFVDEIAHSSHDDNFDHSIVEQKTETLDHMTSDNQPSEISDETQSLATVTDQSSAPAAMTAVEESGNYDYVEHPQASTSEAQGVPEIPTEFNRVSEEGQEEPPSDDDENQRLKVADLEQEFRKSVAQATQLDQEKNIDDNQNFAQPFDEEVGLIDEGQDLDGDEGTRFSELDSSMTLDDEDKEPNSAMVYQLHPKKKQDIEDKLPSAKADSHYDYQLSDVNDDFLHYTEDKSNPRLSYKNDSQTNQFDGNSPLKSGTDSGFPSMENTDTDSVNTENQDQDSQDSLRHFLYSNISSSNDEFTNSDHDRQDNDYQGLEDVSIDTNELELNSGLKDLSRNNRMDRDQESVQESSMVAHNAMNTAAHNVIEEYLKSLVDSEVSAVMCTITGKEYVSLQSFVGSDRKLMTTLSDDEVYTFKQFIHSIFPTYSQKTSQNSERKNMSAVLSSGEQNYYWVHVSFNSSGHSVVLVQHLDRNIALGFTQYYQTHGGQSHKLFQQLIPTLHTGGFVCVGSPNLKSRSLMSYQVMAELIQYSQKPAKVVSLETAGYFSLKGQACHDQKILSYDPTQWREELAQITHSAPDILYVSGMPENVLGDFLCHDLSVLVASGTYVIVATQETSSYLAWLKILTTLK
ncbi:MAG: hypothetical protein OXC40_04345, partial [Proteobacteria bacterium]|nr:hypothetical protein [Pseudomonadota bacterium]